ncbi:hypothetical protein GY45DRAFT_1342655 [Cubamyces sp. BRFM 1775]|nr:hypothetical protein GY45DRAFT_1342655 [Cubamyces sp. BRFM 1775]
MEDDIAFTASVWGAPTEPVQPLALKPPTLAASPGPSTQDDFDDFDNFRTPAETAAGSGEDGDDDFGDFGDFGETQQIPITPGPGGFSSFGSATFDEPESLAGPSFATSAEWRALQLDPLPTRAELQEEVDKILGPLWSRDDVSHLTEEPIREVGGLSQTLVTPESRQLYNALLPPTPPSFQPVNWTRSRIRRQHLISLGIPVNLDEVLPRANGALPMLEITTRPMSAPPGPRGGLSKLQTAAVRNSARSGTSQPGSPATTQGPLVASQLRLGPRPELDEAKVQELLDLSSDRMSLMPLSTLESHLADIKAQTAKTSALLTYLLQMRDALQQDSETYNKLIGELVGEAQKMKSGKRTAGSRRGSGAV